MLPLWICKCILHLNYDVQKMIQDRASQKQSQKYFQHILRVHSTQSYWSLPFEIKAFRLLSFPSFPFFSDHPSDPSDSVLHLGVLRFQTHIKNMGKYVDMSITKRSNRHKCESSTTHPQASALQTSEPPNLGHFALNANVDVVNAVLVIGRQWGSHTLVAEMQLIKHWDRMRTMIV